ncbi:MAG: thermonuclease family protein [Phyllobacterium sp.]|uniref:thermonuclease family protein n=1 Tax=Phyllobacterium sp. TaxID=1871046 RepID=UPI0030EFF6E7
MKRVLLAAVAALITAPALGSDASIIGTASVIDADTIEIHGQRIRIFGVDAPEGRQTCEDGKGKAYRCGQIGSFALDELLQRSQPVGCKAVDRDRYGRIVANCINSKGDNLASWLVTHGYAIDYPQYSKGLYAAEERVARATKAGVWKGKFMKPWDYRKLNR